MSVPTSCECGERIYRGNKCEACDLRLLVDALYTENQKLRGKLAQIADPSPPGWEDRGCSDGHCIVYRSRGQHTNGGCKCHQDNHRSRWVRMRLELAQQIAQDPL